MLVERLVERRTAVVRLLEWKHRDLADAFAGVAPAPGGVFTLGEWVDTGLGTPARRRLVVGRRAAGRRRPVGGRLVLLVDTVVEHLSR